MALQSFSAITRPILCKTKGEKEVLKGLEANLSENDVSAMIERAEKASVCITDHFSKNKINIMQNRERKRGT